jgi:hypothetical protein
MNCSDISNEIALYDDGRLETGAADQVAAHLKSCPLCREALHANRRIRRSLAQLGEPAIPSSLVASLKSQANIFAKPAMFSYPALSTRWLGSFRLASVALAILVSVSASLGLLALLSSPRADGQLLAADRRSGRTTIMLAANDSDRLRDGSLFVSPADFARKRLAVASESPSINPQGALVAVTQSLVRGEMKDDEMVVVARVFGSGLAEITDVVEPPNDARAISELQRALASPSDEPAFVPASLDQRSDEVKVVLKLQSVKVETRPAPRRRS